MLNKVEVLRAQQEALVDRFINEDSYDFYQYCADYDWYEVRILVASKPDITPKELKKAMKKRRKE